MDRAPANALGAQRPDQEVAIVHGPIEADVVQAVLAGYGISTRLESLVPLAVWPLAISGLAEARVLASADDAEAARDLLTGHRQAGLSVVASGGSRRG